MAGFGAGFIKGVLVSVVGAGALSLVVPLDQTDPGNKAQVDLPTPETSGFNTGRSDTNPVLPDTDQTVTADPEPAGDGVSGEAIVESPLTDTQPADRPEIMTGIEMPGVAVDGDDTALLTSTTDDITVTPPAALGVPMPEIDSPVVEIPVNRLPVIEQPTTDVQSPEPAPSEDVATLTELEPESESPGPSGIETDAPLIATEPSAPESSGEADTENSETDPVESNDEPGALMRNKVPFDNPDGKPLFSVILIDTGSSGIERDALLTFTFPVTFAVELGRADAGQASAAFAGGGFEVAALSPLGDAKLEAAESSDDLTGLLTGLLGTTKHAVGLVDEPSAGVQQSPELAAQVIETLKASGHGLVTYDVGLNATDQKARHEGVKAATVYRVLDSDHENATRIKRYLDRAALEAGKDGHVVVLGHTYPETVTALFSWAISAKSSTVAIAPLSAALLAR